MRALLRSAALLAAAFVLPLFALPAAAETPTALVGTWDFVPARSTDLSPWRSSRLTLSLDGSTLTVARALAAGRRTHQDSMTIDLAAPSSTIPLGWWVDNRHIGAYAPHDATQTIRPSLLDGGRVLRLDIDLMLETQQGPRAVNVLRQFQLSPDGQVLTVTDLRSTRPRPVVHVFQRTAP